jgi:hypothetical protein
MSAPASAQVDLAQYRKDMVEAIDASTRIVVSEHSDEGDLFDGYGSLIDSEIVYGEKTLTAKQTRQLRELALSMTHQESKWVDFCAFQPHHAIRFYVGDRLASTLQVCFVCGDVEWLGKEQGPASLVGQLRGFITAIGLHPDRNWRELAREAVRARQARPTGAHADTLQPGSR